MEVAMQRGALVMLALALVAAHSLEDAGENAGQNAGQVTQLDNEDTAPTYSGAGGGDTHPKANPDSGPPGQGPGYYKRGANFPGPKYGLPGYKESHNWEEGVDIFSPVVLNQNYYRAKYSLMGTEKELKLDWINKLTSNSAGSCPKGKIDWDLDKLYTNYPSSYTGTDDNGNPAPATCMQILKNFLSTGLYNGHQGTTGYKIFETSTTPPAQTFALGSGLSTLTDSFDTLSLIPDQTYTYTFWLKVSDTASGVSSILWYGKCDGTPLDCIAPTVALSMKDASTDLEFQVRHSNDDYYKCDANGATVTTAQPGYLVLGQWYYIALAVESFHSTSSKMILYVDGTVACENDNTAGTTMAVDSGAKLYMGQGVLARALADVDKVMFYPGRQVSAAELGAQEDIEQTPTPAPVEMR